MTTYRLVLGQKNYSSWSMRAWLLMKWRGLAFEVTTAPLYTPQSRAAVRALGGETGLVPVLLADDLAIWDTLAIFEFIDEAHRGVWPADAAPRARARSLAGEIHSGLNALRAAMPFNARARGRRAVRSADVEADIDRVRQVWSRAAPSSGGWLLGDFGAIDILYAPVASRFQTYGVDLGGGAGIYQARLLAHPLVAEWLRLGAAEMDVIPVLELGGDGRAPHASTA